MVYFLCLEILKENNYIAELNGRIGDIRYTGISSDLNVASNSIVQVMKYNIDTLNTPKTEGITVSGDGIVISYANSRYGVQICAAQAIDTLFVRRKLDSTWSEWNNLVDVPSKLLIGIVYNQDNDSIKTLVNKLVNDVKTRENGVYYYSGSFKNHAGGYAATVNRISYPEGTIRYYGTIQTLTTSPYMFIYSSDGIEKLFQLTSNEIN